MYESLLTIKLVVCVKGITAFRTSNTLLVRAKFIKVWPGLLRIKVLRVVIAQRFTSGLRYHGLAVFINTCYISSLYFKLNLEIVEDLDR